MVNHWARHRRRRFYSWYLTFEDCGELHEVASLYGRALVGQAVDVVPLPWLHLTLWGVGDADAVSDDEIARVADEARARCSSLSAFDVSVERVVVHPEAVLMLVAPREPLEALRSALGGESGPFVPHISLAYSRSEGPAAPLVDAVRAVDPGPVTVRVGAAQLLLVRPEDGAYRWSWVATVALSP